VLESKDREQLLAIASALGVKANSRTKKGDIVDRILEQVRGDAQPSAGGDATPVNGHANDAKGGAAVAVEPLPEDAAVAVAAPGAVEPRGAEGPAGAGAPGSETAGAGSAATTVGVLPADPFEEPPAEWELALDGGDGAPSEAAVAGSTAAPAGAPAAASAPV